MAEQDYSKALENLESDKMLHQLTQDLTHLNIFEVLGTTRAEIRHSNFLAWLLDPNGNHEMGGKFLRAFVAKMGQEGLLPPHISKCSVRREWRHTDLLVLCPDEKYLLCVENKVFSGEHDNQLHHYRDVLLAEYHGYTMSLAFLSPDGVAPASADDQQYWQPVSYADILDAIESAKDGSTLLPEVNMLLDHYTAAVRRHIVGDDNIKARCQEIYERHKEALELIYENCKTDIAPMRAAVEGWCKKKNDEQTLIFDPQFSNNTYTRFTTKTIRELFPQHERPVSGWKSTDMAVYEITKRDDYFKVTLCLCSDNLTDAQRAACNRAGDELDRPDKKPDWRWKRIQNWGRHTITAEPGSSEYAEEIQKALDEDWKKIQDFEEKLIEKIR